MTSYEIKSQISSLRYDLQNGEITKELALPQIKALNEQLNKAVITEKITEVNTQQAKYRVIAAELFDCERPKEDITTNSGDLHKVKAKRYPKLAAFCEKHHARLNFSKSGILRTVKVGSKEFNLYYTTYESGNTDYTEIATYAEFLTVNSIFTKDLTEKEYSEKLEKLKQAEEALTEAFEAYEAYKESEKPHILEKLGLLHRYNKTIYTYDSI